MHALNIPAGLSSPWSDADEMDIPVQLRLGFPADDEAVQLTLVLAGLTVLVDEAEQRYDAAYRALTQLDVAVSWHDAGGLSFPIREIRKLSSLTGDVATDQDLAALWEFVESPSANDVPATLRQRADNVVLEWVDALGELHVVALPPASVPALLAADVPFAADTDAWRHIEQHATVPVLAGRAQLNADGFVEIHTSTPQLVEAAPLPGLFRLDDTHFGMPTGLVSALDSARGFLWVGERPSRPPVFSIPPSIDITDHVANGASELASRIEAHKAAALVWDPGLGRRIAVLAALDSLDAWPLLVVCDPSAIWLWQRHIELVGKEASFGHTDADARIITWHDLQRVALDDPIAVVFDEPFSKEATHALRAAHRFDALRDVVRIAVTSTWRDDDASIVQLMELVRPQEFRSDVPVAWRYPLRPSERLREHAESHVMRLEAGTVPQGVTARFRRDSIASCSPTQSQLSEFANVLELYEADEESPEVLVSLLEEATSAGTSSSPSPKLAEAVERTKSAISKGRTVAVVVGSPKTANRLKMLLRPLRVDLVDEVEARNPDPTLADVTVVRARDRVPSLRAFDEVIVCEYPRSFSALDSAVGPADGPGPQKVTVVHMHGSIDDRLAINAALARDHGLANLFPDPVQLLQDRA
jgi:hypothetical protein